ncbi:MAG TPA: glycosyltransferase [Pyrinomonadaceae bacterium]|jgi:GT2 family glycosyltransferase
MQPSGISVIVPTIGRPESLRNLLQSLSIQTVKVSEVIVADGSSTIETEAVINDPQWRQAGLIIRHLQVQPPNAVRQREAAICESVGELLLLLDDDVVLEPDCVEQLAQAMTDGSEVVAVTADLKNESWSRPTKIWRWYLKYALGLDEDEWQGRVLGPLLRFGYYIPHSETRAIEWMGAGNSLVSKSAYQRAGGFSDFFLHRCTMNEDVDISIKLLRLGTILFCPKAKLSHFHASSGRLSLSEVAEDDIHNRFLILHRTVGYNKVKAFKLVLLYYFIETMSDLFGLVRLKASHNRVKRISGRSRAMSLIILKSIHN